jgi:pyruvate-ferredoxin/flavodoxin oxidoreductase
MPRVIGGRYGLSSKEFTPAMAKAVFDELRSRRRKRHFTVGIVDDVTHLSLKWTAASTTEPPACTAPCSTASAPTAPWAPTRTPIKIIGENTPLHAQGYFVYDSKKSGAITVSHLRFGEAADRQRPTSSSQADFVAATSSSFLEQARRAGALAAPGAVAAQQPLARTRSGTSCPRGAAADHRANLQVLRRRRAGRGAQAGLAGRINTVMQACFFALSGVLPRDEAHRRAIKAAIRKSLRQAGERSCVNRNVAAVDASLAHLHEVTVPAGATRGSTAPRRGAARGTRLRAARHAP